ncbi:MAG TPA: SMC-Scp complex subunit ScpB [Candidatus Krumholzibacteria bacterium]|nr:SMC-Scp complex subunit ScpB [Candidatus Krumholzibacteria bacterium]
MENPNLDNIVLALLFASDEPLSARKIAALIEDVTSADVKQAIETWNARANAEAWSIGIEQVAGGYRLATRPDYAPYVSRLSAGRRKFLLSRAGLETLAIIAYKQPITRAEIESIRGVGSGSVVANLMERALVQIVGKAKVLGAPFLYGTTQEFLEYLGLNSLRDLPSMEDLEALLAKEASAEMAIEGETPETLAENGDALVERIVAEANIDEYERLDNLDGSPQPTARSANLGPQINEPMNRPVTSGSVDLADETDDAENAENPDDDSDDIRP